MEKWISEDQVLDIFGVPVTESAKKKLVWLGYRKKVKQRRILGVMQYEEGSIITYNADKK